MTKTVSKTVLSFGEVLWDMLPDGPVLGGAPGNFAYRMNSLGDRALMVSRLGQDELGDKAWNLLGELGMERRFIQRDERLATGTVSITLDANRNPDFVIHPGVAYDAIEATPELLSAAAEADCFCFGTLIQRTEPSRQALRQLLDASPVFDGTRGCLKVLDINFRKDCYSLEVIRSSLEAADVLKLNDQEALELSDMLGLSEKRIPEFCDRIIERQGLHGCLVTLGERGAFAASREGEKAYVPGYEVPLVDTCGSGDSFSAGFVHLLLRGRALAECCRVGNALGALVATKAGATALISLEELEAFLSSETKRVSDSALEAFGAT